MDSQTAVDLGRNCLIPFRESDVTCSVRRMWLSPPCSVGIGIV